MGFLENIKNIFHIKNKETISLGDANIREWFGLSEVKAEAMSEATYFTCLKMLSETLGKMSIKFYQDTERGIVNAESNRVYRLLKNRPNPLMTPTTFFSTLENNRNNSGNAYAWIQRGLIKKKYGAEQGIKALWVMPSQNVQVIIDDVGIFAGNGDIYYWYSDKYSGESYVFPSRDVLHFKTSTSFDGITGAAVKDILENTIDGGLQSQKFMNNLYRGGLTAKAALQYTGTLNEKLQKQLVKNFEEYANGANNAGKFIPIPIGFKIEPLNIKLTDSQFFELKKYSALQIAGAFGIKPNQINDYEKSSYENSEMQNISFYVDTELYILKQYEEEMTYKLLTETERKEGMFFKFNESAILRTDAKTQAEILTSYVQNGVYTPNEARSYRNMASIEGGDDLICNGNYIKVKTIEGKEEGGKTCQS